MVEARAAQLRQIWRAPFLVWLALCALLILTYIVAYIPLGSANLWLSLGIAGVKSSLVGAVFMRLSERNALNRLAASAGPIWVFFMFLLIFTDYLSR